jgi:molybdopterin-guanine dinucleotide biosynthesis protein A
VVLWTDQHAGREALFDGPNDPFFNVNTPEDLQQARAMQKDTA